MRRHLSAAAIVPLLAVQSASAQVVRQVTTLYQSTTTGAALDDAGTKVFAIIDANPYGTNPGRRLQIFSWNPATGVGSQVTAFPQGVDRDPYEAGPSVTDDGAKIAFLLDSRLALINADGTGLVQLTTQPATIFHFQIAGNGSRVVFDSTTNLTGQNAAGAAQVFAVEANGSGLRQLTSQVNVWPGAAWPTISDDGQRIAYVSSDGTVNGNLQLAGVLQDGTGFHFITSVASVNAGFLQISGNGQSVAFQNSGSLMEPGGCSGSTKVAIVEWNGTGLLPLDAPCNGASIPGFAGPPDITDDAQVIYYDASEFGSDVFKINRDRTGKVRVTDAGAQPGPRAYVEFTHVAGGGSRIAFQAEGGTPWGGPNPDLGIELYAASGTGTAKLQLTDLPSGDARAPAITPDATRMVFTSTEFSVAPPAYVVEQVFRSAPDGSGAVQLTSFASGTVANPSITDDGTRIVFTHQAPVESPVDESDEVFSVNADGTNLLSLTGTTLTAKESAHVAGNGSVVVLVAKDLLNEGGVTGWPVYRMQTNGTGVARVSPKTVVAGHPRVDATGTWVVYQTSSATPEVHRQPVDGTLDQVIGAGASSDGYADVTPGGGLVVYDSQSNPLGTNPDGNRELFLWEAATGTTRQLTATASVRNTRPAFTRDGAWVYYWRIVENAAFVDEYEPYRVNVVTATSERVGGLSGCTFSLDTPYYVRLAPPSASANASLAVFGANGDCTGENRDGNNELVAVDRRVVPVIRISGGSGPTIVSWDVESGPTSYDVIRGDRASLAFRGDGSVDLGSVSCLENDSLDATTAQAPDAAIPAPGEVFFYLYRGAPGTAAYGVASSGSARLPSSGDCGP